MQCLMAGEAEADIYHLQLLEELRRLAPIPHRGRCLGCCGGLLQVPQWGHNCPHQAWQVCSPGEQVFTGVPSFL